MDMSLRKVNGMQGCIGCNHFEHYLMIINSKLIPIFPCSNLLLLYGSYLFGMLEYVLKLCSGMQCELFQD